MSFLSFRLLLGFLLLQIISSSQSKAEQRNYDGYSLISINPESEDQLNIVKVLAQNDVERGIDFWVRPTVVGRPVTVMVNQKSKSQVLSYLESNNMFANETISDLGSEIRSNAVELNRQFGFLLGTRPASTVSGYDAYFSEYQSHPNIERKLMSFTTNPEVTIKTLGRSYENRNIYVIQVSNSPNKGKPVILIDAGHHAREWISHSTIMFMIDSIISGNSSRTKLRSKLDQYDFWFVPNVNPDGYEYSSSVDRMWRKTRSRGRYCYGADPNRNYDMHWRGPGASSNECSEIYHGTKAESEIEMILWPYGYANEAPANEELLRVVATAGINAIRAYRGTSYTIGRVADVLYPASGGADDYAMGVCNIPFVYTIELPDKGRRGFLLPKTEIVPVGIETESGIAAMIDKMSEITGRS